jgi:hypothetical protein
VVIAISDQGYKSMENLRDSLILFECTVPKLLRRTNILEFLILPCRNAFSSNIVVVELRNVQSHTSHKDLSCGQVLSDFNFNSQFLRILSSARIYIYFLSQEIMPGLKVSTESEATKVTAPIRTLRSRGSDVRKPSASASFPSQATFISQVC